MVRALTPEQVKQMVDNTVLVLLVRPDLMGEWHDNLVSLLQQTRESDLDDEMFFVAAVLTLLHNPDDTLPTGTVYDHAWESLLVGLQTGVMQPAATEGEAMTLDRLLNSVVEAVLAVIKHATDQKETVRTELRQIKETATGGGEITELTAWLDDTIALLDGTPIHELGQGHQGVYAAYWDVLVRNLKSHNG